MAALERRRGDHAGSRHFAIAHSNRQIRIEWWRNKSDVALRTVVDFGLIVQIQATKQTKVAFLKPV